MLRKCSHTKVFCAEDRLWLFYGFLSSPVDSTLGRQRLHSVQCNIKFSVCATTTSTTSILHFRPILGAALAFVRHHPVQKHDDEDSEHDHVTHVFARRRV